MDHFHLRDGELYAEDVPLARIAEEVGTPVYVYSRATLERHARVFREALGRRCRRVHLAFAVKANPNLAVLRVLQREGFGADVVSGGELARALAAGMPAEDIVFSGVGKQHWELVRGARRRDRPVQPRIRGGGRRARRARRRARGCARACALRVNPDVDAGTHDKISTGKADNKFGVPIGEAAAIYARLAALPGLEMRGARGAHRQPAVRARARSSARSRSSARCSPSCAPRATTVTHVDLGGGLGVPYKAGDVHAEPGRVRRDGRARHRRAGTSR